MTQAELADSLGIRSNTVARYERGLLAIPRVVELAIKTVERNHNRRAKGKRARAAITHSADSDPADSHPAVALVETVETRDEVLARIEGG